MLRSFLDDCTTRSTIGYWHGNIVGLSVRPSVCLWRCMCIVAKRYILQTSDYRTCPRSNTILQLSTPTSTLRSQTHYLLNHRRWCHVANKLKTYCEQANRQIQSLDEPSSLVSMLHGYSRIQYTPCFSYVSPVSLYCTVTLLMNYRAYSFNVRQQLSDVLFIFNSYFETLYSQSRMATWLTCRLDDKCYKKNCQHDHCAKIIDMTFYF